MRNRKKKATSSKLFSALTNVLLQKSNILLTTSVHHRECLAQIIRAVHCHQRVFTAPKSSLAPAWSAGGALASLLHFMASALLSLSVLRNGLFCNKTSPKLISSSLFSLFGHCGLIKGYKRWTKKAKLDFC